MPTPYEGRTPPGRIPGRAGAQMASTHTTPAVPGDANLTDDAELIASLSLNDKVLLLTGADSWRTQGAEALGLRPIVMSDGPAGARGVTLDERQPSTSLPCPSALGATWDVGLVRELAAALGAEARSKGIDVLLGPTINLMRTPAGGRGFECFAEDPVLTARIAVSYVTGLQQAGVAATIKHYVGNDSETQRWSYDARISEHVLRELYLAPFEACVRDADAALVMAAYNKVNGMPMTEHTRLLAGVLKGEWGFTGVVTSDWHATRSTTETALATLDLAMPGPGGPWGDLLARAVCDGLVTEQVLDDKLIRLLRLARRVGALERPGPVVEEPVVEESVVEGPVVEDSVRLVDPDLLRRVTAASFVLLSNVDRALPLDPDQITKLALIGPGALAPTIQGGGAVVVAPTSVSTPAEALTSRLGNRAEVSVAEGCQIWGTVPGPELSSIQDPVTGEAGVHLRFVAADGTVLRTEHRTAATLAWWDGAPPGFGWGEDGSVVLDTLYRPGVTGPHLIGAAGVGRLTITVDGETVADRPTVVPADPVQAMTKPGQVRAGVDLTAGRQVRLTIEFRPAADGEGPLAVKFGVAPSRDDQRLIATAVAAARGADAAVVVVGSAELTESEGFDRPTLALPGRQDELVSSVAAVNNRTIVVVNSGMPVLMPWADQVAAVIQAWLPGQAVGEALADVLLGTAEPGGRLPVTLPAAEADCPVLDATPADGVLDYREGLLIGYRGYDAAGTAPMFPFGHGLGYTDWGYEMIQAMTADHHPGLDLELRVVVRNTGSRPGREVVQAYLAGPADDPARPVRALAAFGIGAAAPGESVQVRLTIPARAFAHWDEQAGDWIWPPGPFTVQVGRSSRDLRLSLPVPSG
ncbi:MAG TPA: glycoside hydrolase family 3 C-terminal domain-containing protein [Streptosporangiaceae bacterium]|nr:glycoside hydrolase family 3 C-terminal domain-containing protein [Streptosporangiaceae bacterium]